MEFCDLSGSNDNDNGLTPDERKSDFCVSDSNYKREVFSVAVKKTTDFNQGLFELDFNTKNNENNHNCDQQVTNHEDSRSLNKSWPYELLEDKI